MNRQPPARPVFFNLTQIQMPVGAITSIAHRAPARYWSSAFRFS